MTPNYLLEAQFV